MSREVILNFIFQNYQQLFSIDFNEITIYQYGKSFSNDVVSAIDNGQNLYIYNVKLPRINYRVASLEYMNEGILELLNSVEDIKVFSINDFDFEIVDPYLNRKINELKYKYIYLLPVKRNQELLGGIIVYSSKLDDDFNFSKLSITSLFNNLTKSYEEELISSINNSLNDLNDYYYMIKDPKKDKIVISSNFRDKYNLSNNICKDIELIEAFTGNSLTMNKKMMFNGYEYLIYYIRKMNFESTNLITYHYTSLNKIKLPEKFYLLYIQWDEELNKKEFINYVSKLSIRAHYNVYSLKYDNYLLIIEGDLDTRLISQKLSLKKIYYLIIHSPKQISNKMDILRLTNYIVDMHPEKYIEKEYLAYLKYTGIEKFRVNNQKFRQIICNSLDKNLCYQVINNSVGDILYENNSKEYEKNILKKITLHINNCLSVNSDINNYAVFIQTSILKKKRFLDLLSLSNDYKLKPIIIIHYDKMPKNDFYQQFSLLLDHNVTIIVDSSIFLNLELIDVMRFVDGIYINKNEFKSIKNCPDEFFNYFITYYYNENKKIILEFDDSNDSFNYRSDLIYYILESEGK